MKNEIILPIKPLSVNEAWKGRRFKTDKYKSYEKHCLLLLPKLKIPSDEKLKIQIEYGFSSKGSDLDNPTKSLLDILQKKYDFNDSQVYEIILRKSIVEKGKEFSKIIIEFLPEK